MMMKKLLVLLCCMLAASAFAQSVQSRIFRGPSLPSVCYVGDVFHNYTTGVTSICTAQNSWISSSMSGTTSAIGGSALLAGACSSGTVTVTGATTGMTAIAQPSDGTVLADGNMVYAVVSSANTVTVKVCGIVGITPPSKTYSVRVIP